MPLDTAPTMITVTARLRSLSRYSQSRPHLTERLEKEGHDEFDKRTWREKAHCDATGRVFIPPMAIKNCLADASSFLNLKIAGRGRATYTKHFAAGVMCVEPIFLALTKDQLQFEDVFVDATGKRNSGSRVWRRFPVVDEWEATAVLHILDRTITRDIFERVLVEAGSIVGIGRFRPRNWGYYGRFGVVDLQWDDPASA